MSKATENWRDLVPFQSGCLMFHSDHRLFMKYSRIKCFSLTCMVFQIILKEDSSQIYLAVSICQLPTAIFISDGNNQRKSIRVIVNAKKPNPLEISTFHCVRSGNVQTQKPNPLIQQYSGDLAPSGLSEVKTWPSACLSSIPQWVHSRTKHPFASLMACTFGLHLLQPLERVQQTLPFSITQS